MITILDLLFDRIAFYLPTETLAGRILHASHANGYSSWPTPVTVTINGLFLSLQFLTVLLAFSPSFHWGMPFRLLRLINAPAFTFTTVRAGLTTVDDTPSFKSFTTDITTAFGAYLICHFHFLLVRKRRGYFYPAFDR
jgi:hypothetical protein